MTTPAAKTPESLRERPLQRREKLLLVDDDAKLGVLVAEYFATHGYQLDVAPDGRAGLAMALTGRYELVILDVMLPVIDGFEVLRQLRGRTELPVIMLTARAGQSDRIAGLNGGADDYLTKPFDPQELVARVSAVFRRVGHPGPLKHDTIRVGAMVLDPGRRQVTCGDREIALTSIEFDILALLLRSAGRPVSRDQIAAIIYHRETSAYERAIDVHVSHLRKKLEPADDLIRTIRGVGYLFQAEA
jgi:two-component system response regulator CpxR